MAPLRTQATTARTAPETAAPASASVTLREVRPVAVSSEGVLSVAVSEGALFVVASEGVLRVIVVAFRE